MKVKDLLDKIGKLSLDELTIITNFLILVVSLNIEDQKTVQELFELLDKKIRENFIKKKK